MKLTPAQERYLAEIRETPGRKYNGRARRTLTALRQAGLIRYHFDLVPGNANYSEQFTCFPVEESR
jgi:hypothetical protein